MIKKNEVLIHECSKHGNISWKNPTKCISGTLLVQVLAREAKKWDGDILRDELGEGNHIP